MGLIGGEGSANSLDLQTVLHGRLHCVVAVDWCDEVDLERASQLVPSEPQALLRRRRTPATIAYRPPPLRFRLPSIRLALPGLETTDVDVEVMVFDFGAANVVFRIPFHLPMSGLSAVAVALVEPDRIVSHARAVAEPLFNKLVPSMDRPRWHELSEEYFIFQLDPGDHLPAADEFVRRAGKWIAELLRLESGSLCQSEIAESLRYQISYFHSDVVIVEWAAALVLDTDCDETLQTIAFANLQLLEFRVIDQQVGKALAAARRHIGLAVRSWLPFWRTYSRPLRSLNEIRLDAVGTFERASDVLQLVGDQYLSRVYRLLSSRFRLDQWSENVRRSLDVTQGVHETLSSQAAMYRLELLEAIVVLLIALEIVMALYRP